VTGYDDDIESADDLYDAIGSMLEGLDSNMEDDTIREICRRLHHTRLKYALCSECFIFLLYFLKIVVAFVLLQNENEKCIMKVICSLMNLLRL